MTTLRRRRLQRSTRVDMVPMIDVVFQLVIFFMVSSTFKITPAIGLTLPESATAVPTEMTRLIVTVHSQDVIYLNERKLDLAGLANAFGRDGIDPQSVQSIIVEVDEGASSQILVHVMDVLRMNGISAVALRTRLAPGRAVP
ncbi:MAG: biopolymer transporter ExbD [Spirochaetaceae bacterium]|nr:biopolymer transporter ExbD [Spirochaetaceae bacterium]